jgi:hypothetical protein
MPSMKASSDCVLAGYELESLREDLDFTLYRGWRRTTGPRFWL